MIKFEEKLFILTQEHVLDAHVPTGVFQNESPFFSHIFSQRFNSDITEVAFPIRGWKTIPAETQLFKSHGPGIIIGRTLHEDLLAQLISTLSANPLVEASPSG